MRLLSVWQPTFDSPYTSKVQVFKSSCSLLWYLFAHQSHDPVLNLVSTEKIKIVCLHSGFLGPAGFSGTFKDQCFDRGPWALPLLPGESGGTWSHSSGLRLDTCLESCSTGRGACAGILLTTSSSLGSPLLCISGENRQSSWNWGELGFNEILKSPFWPLCLLQLLASSWYFFNKFVKID